MLTTNINVEYILYVHLRSWSSRFNDSCALLLTVTSFETNEYLPMLLLGYVTLLDVVGKKGINLNYTDGRLALPKSLQQM